MRDERLIYFKNLILLSLFNLINVNTLDKKDGANLLIVGQVHFLHFCRPRRKEKTHVVHGRQKEETMKTGL